MSIPTEHDDPINASILRVSEDMVSGFQREPFRQIAEGSGVDLEIVLERIRAMLEAGVIRRVRQTMLATKTRPRRPRCLEGPRGETRRSL